MREGVMHNADRLFLGRTIYYSNRCAMGSSATILKSSHGGAPVVNNIPQAVERDGRELLWAHGVPLGGGGR